MTVPDVTTVKIGAVVDVESELKEAGVLVLKPVAGMLLVEPFVMGIVISFSLDTLVVFCHWSIQVLIQAYQ
jgi:hypothetical protein